jgi:hypothetical protein
MENGPFSSLIDVDLPMKDGDFPWLLEDYPQ